MKVILYAAMTINGWIAGPEGETPWSDEEWQAYHEAVTHAGHLVVGRKTYEIMEAADDFKKIGNPFTVVLTRSSLTPPAKNIVIAQSPQQAAELLRARDCSEVILGGGAQCNTAFLEAGLVDEVCLDIEPLIFGAGVPLIAPGDWQRRATLLSVRTLSRDVIQVRYQLQNN